MPPPPPPPPVGGGLLAYPRATFLDRMAAFAIDALLVAIAANVLDVMPGRAPGFFAVLVVYHIAFWTWKGTTLGGIIVGLRMVRTSGADPVFADALVRGLTAILSVAALGIGCFWMLSDPQQQMWHDKIANTVVVKVPRDVALA
jgi:uncharacterized RDD family membrane protein YckC